MRTRTTAQRHTARMRAAGLDMVECRRDMVVDKVVTRLRTVRPHLSRDMDMILGTSRVAISRVAISRAATVEATVEVTAEAEVTKADTECEFK